MHPPQPRLSISSKVRLAVFMYQIKCSIYCDAGHLRLLPAAPWGNDIEEYENQDDVGYIRRDVVGQQQFIELELDLDSEQDSDHLPAPQPGVGPAPDAVSESSSSEEIPAVLGEAMYSAEGSPTPSSNLPDEAWDLGPVGIKFAEPVTTPSKSTTKQDEPRPVLSRVESLSSSFKDFDIEGNDEDMCSGRLSIAQSDADQQLSDAEVIDFPPVPLAHLTAEDLAAFGQQQPQHSKASSVQATEGSAVCPLESPVLTTSKPQEISTTPSGCVM